MPSELQRVAQRLVDSLNEIPRVIAALDTRARICRDHAAIVMQLSGGSATVAAQQLDAAARACEAAAHCLSQAPPKAHGWAQQMVGGIRTAGPTGDDASPQEEAAPGRRMGDEDGRRLQQKLPKLEEAGVTRPKTRGLWVDENGDEEQLVSGQHDEWFQKATDFLRERGIPKQGSIMTPSHVETKFALRMRVRGLKHETITVNKVPCKGEWGCETILGHILPEGSTLTVFGPDGFKRTYPLPADE